MSNAPKAPKLYPGTKYKDMSGDYTVTKDNYSGGKGFKANVKGEGESGKAGGHMGPGKALEKGGCVITGGKFGANGTYGKSSGGKGKTPSFKEVK